jgi:AcrR family transcriptional regulator
MFYNGFMDNTITPVQRLLSATEKLIYSNGITATGLDAIVKESGVARRTIYRNFTTKDGLVAEVLKQRDKRWMNWFVQATSQNSDPKIRLLSTFDALEEWFHSSDFNGCAFINAAGEVGNTSEQIAAIAKEHKVNLENYLESLAKDYGATDPKKMAADFLILIDGAITVAKVMGDKEAAKNAKHLALRLLETEK